MTAASHSAIGGAWQRVALWFGFGVVVVTIAGLGGTSSLVWGPIAFLCFAFTAGFVVTNLRARTLPAWNPLLWPAAAFGAVVLAQYVFGFSVYAGATLTSLLQLGSYGCLFYLGLAAFQRASNLRKAGLALSLLAGAVAAEALAQAFTAGKSIYWSFPRPEATPVGPFIYHNHFAGCMELLLPLTVAVAVSRGRGGRTDWAKLVRRGLIPTLCLAAVIVSQSRGGFMILLLEGVVAAVIYRKTLLQWRRSLLGALVVTLAVGGIVAMVGWQPLLRRFTALQNNDVSLTDRVMVTQSCLNIWRDHPWIGTGLGTFPAMYPQYQKFDTGQQWLEAHDDFAQTLAETGVAGMAAVLVFLAFYWLRGLQVMRTPRPDGLQHYQTAAFIGTVGLMAHSLGDFQFHSPANALLFFYLSAAATAHLGGSGRGERQPQSRWKSSRSLRPFVAPVTLRRG